MIYISENLLIGWCRTRMRRARLVSNAFLYTTVILYHKKPVITIFLQDKDQSRCFSFPFFVTVECSKKDLTRRHFDSINSKA